jgi:small subunit ribosomal protein S20
MAHSRSARKRIRQNEHHAAMNKPVRTRAAHALRDARAAIKAGSAEATAAVRTAQSALDRAARRNVIHPNTAARSKARLSRALKAMQTA